MAFVLATRTSLVGPNCGKWYIFNMDQTPLWFSYHQSTTLQLRGAKTIHMRKSTNDTPHTTAVALTCTAASKFLRPMIIFKEKPKGFIMKKELPTFDPTSDYTCQINSWMDKRCMLMWVEECLNSYLESLSSSGRHRAGNPSRFIPLSPNALGR